MDNQNVDKKNYDIASISRPGKTKRANYIQDALHVSKEKIETSGKFIRVFADVFLKREAGNKSYF
jgi:hypothetical protein